MSQFVDLDMDIEDEEASNDGAVHLALLTIMHDKKLLASSADILDEFGFFEASSAYSFVWDILYEYYKEYAELPSKPFILKEIDLRYPSFEGKHPHCPETLESLKKMVSEGYDGKGEEVDRQVVRDLIKDHLNVSARRLFEEAENIEEGIKNASRALSLDPLQSVHEATIIVPLEEQGENLKSAPKIPLYVDFLDEMLNGGLNIGNSLCLIIPTGVGKTTLTYQMAHGHAMASTHCVVVTLEQYADVDVKLRNAVLASGAPRSDWERIRNEKDPMTVYDLSEDAKKRYNLAYPLMVKYIHTIDTFASETAQIRSVTDLYEQCFDILQDSVRDKVDTFIIDWWGPLRNRLLASRGRIMDQTFVRWYMEDCKRAIKTCSQKYGVRTVVFHQIGGGSGGKSPNSRASTTDAMEDKNFNQMFDYAMAASRLNPVDNTTTFVMDKARGEKQTDMKVELVGERCFMRKASHMTGGSSMVEEFEDDPGVLFRP